MFLTYWFSNSIIHSLSEIICSIAKVDLPKNEWSGFWNFFYQLGTSEVKEHKELSFYILNELAQDICGSLRPEFPNLIKLLCIGMNPDENPSVKIMSVKASGSLITSLVEDDEDLSHFSVLIPCIVETSKFCVESYQDEAHYCFETISNIIDIIPNLINNNIIPIIEIIFSIATNTSIEWEIRLSALSIIEVSLRKRPSWFVKNKIVNTLIDVCCQIGSEPNQNEYDVWDESPFRHSGTLISLITRYIHPNHTYAHLLYCIDALSKSTELSQRKMALQVITYMSDGCSEEIRRDLDKYIPFIIHCFHDKSIEIRKDACLVLGKLSEFVKPEILQYHEQIMPCLFSSFQEKNDEILETTCYSLMHFIEDLDENIIGLYVDDLMRILMNIINSTASIDTQEMVIMNIGNLSLASGNSFMKYLESTINFLSEVAIITEESKLCLRARAIDVAGSICSSIGAENFSPYLEHFMKAAFDSFLLPRMTVTSSNGEKYSNDLRECALNFLTSIVQTYGDSFEPYLNPTIECIVQILDSTPEVEKNEDLGQILSQLDDEDDDDNEEEEKNQQEYDEELDEMLQRMEYTHTLTEIDEKCCALRCLGAIAEFTTTMIIPFIEVCMPLVSNLSKSLIPSARKASIYTIESFVVAVNRAYPPAKEGWKPGLPIEEYSLHESTQNFLDDVITTLLGKIEVDFDLTCSSRYVEAISFFVKKIGVPGIHKNLNAIIDVITEILEEQTLAQSDALESEDNEEMRQDSILLFLTTSNLIETLSEYYEHEFIPYIPSIVPGLLDLLNSNDPSKEEFKHTIPGIFINVVCNIGIENIPNDLLEVLLDISFKGIHHEDEDLRVNSIVLLGFISCNEQTFELYEKILESIMYLIVSENSLKIVENACASLARMIVSAPQKIPYDHILEPFFDRLPLKEIFEEEYTINQALVKMLEIELPQVTSYIPKIVGIFTEDIGKPEMEESVVKKMKDALRFLWNKYNTELQSVIEQLSEVQRNNFESCLN